MNHQLDHAAPSPNVLPPSPYGPPQPSSHRTNTHVDLTVDESQSQSQNGSPISIYEDDLLPCHATPRLRQSPANAERRSGTGHPPRKPSNATRAPDPANGYQGPQMTKPGADKAFRPANTMGGSTTGLAINPAYGPKHVKTYGKQGRHHKSNTWDQFPGRQEYLERHSQRSSISHGDRASQPSPAKRRKVEHHINEPIQTVEIGDSEEDEPQQRPPAPRQASTPRANSTVSSQSPYSATSKRSETESKRRALPKSEFSATSDLLAAKRRRPRHKNSVEADKPSTSLFNGSPVLAGSLSHGTHAEDTSSIEPLEYDSIERAERRVHLQPESHRSSNHSPEKVISKFFQRDLRGPRTNESNGERRSNEAQLASRPFKNLRDYQPAGSHLFKAKADLVENSEDELGQSDSPRSKPLPAHSNPTRQAKSTSRSKKAGGREYRLSYARTYTTEPGSKDLLLSQNDPSDRTHYRISGTDVDGKEKTLHQLNLQSVTKAVADDTHCIRLTGGTPAYGNRFWYDLRFEDINEFKHFRDNVIFSKLAQSYCLVKDSAHLKSLFSKPLQASNTIDQSPVQGGTPERTQSRVGQQPRPQPPSLRARMKDALNASGTEASNLDSLRDPAPRTRPFRNTRATASSYQDEKKVEKFSQTNGLGKPWANHLDFSIQESFLKRRRCTVNFDDLPKLDEEEFLNDSLVNFYLLYLYNELKVSIDRVYFFNTYFFDTLTKNTKKGEAINYDAVKSWTKRDDVFSYDHIVVPINEKFHWYLAIICNISNIPRKLAAEQSEEVAQDSDPNTTDPAALAVTASSTAIGVEQQSLSKSATPVPELPISKAIEEDDDENLFEEEKLNLIDPEEEDAAGKQPSADGQTLFDGQAEREADSEAAANLALPTAQLQDHVTDSVPFKPRQPAKKKKQGGPKKDPEKPVIAVLDSLGSMHSNATRALREWLEAEGLEKRNMIVEIDNKGYYPKSAHIPMQNNFSDCGLYVLGYAKKFFADPDGFKNKLLQAEMSSATDWPDMDASKMREDIRDLLFRLYKDQDDARKEARKAKAAARTKSAPPTPPKDGSAEGGIAEQQADVASTEASPLAPPAADSEPQPATAPTERVMTPGTTSGTRADKEQPLEANNVEVTAPATPPIKESPQKTRKTPKPALANGSPAKRHKSPEVRISTKSPLIDTSLYERFDGAVDRTRQSQRRATDLSSPLRKHGLHSKSSEEARTLSNNEVKRKSRSPRKDPSPSSLGQSRTRSGSHDDPIPLEDSQDLDAPLQRQTRSPKPPAKNVIELDRSQEDTITPRQRGSPTKRKGTHIRFPDDDSIQEVFSPQDWQESRDISRAMKASMQDQHAQQSAQSRDPAEDHIDLWEGSFDDPAVPSESSHTLDQVSETQLMDVDGAEVPESPQERRSSPAVAGEEMEWQASRV